tara:strand:+ start:3765 stop:5780 length:2016 start_codon:yes stop_codon:yes gene_type:complete
MIFDLSKDKSLAGLLKRVELDEETKELVNQGSSATLIKMSLVKNMNSSNIVQYRRYIQKAEEEETEEQRKERLEAEKDVRARGTEEQRTDEGAQLEDVEEAVSGRDRGSSVSELAEQEDKRQAELRGEKDAAKEKQKKLSLAETFKKNKEAKKKIEKIQGFSAALKKITDKLDMKSGEQIRTREFERFVGPNKERGIKVGNELISLVGELETDKKALVKSLSDVLRNFKLYEGTTDTGEKRLTQTLRQQFVPMVKDKGEYVYSEDKNKIIDIPALQDELLSYIREYPVEGGEPVPLSKALNEMFRVKFNRNAARFIDRKQQKKVSDALMGYSKGKDPKTELGFKRAKKNIDEMKKFIRSFRDVQQNLEDRIEDLSDMKEDSGALMKRKVKTIKEAIKVMLTNRKGLADENQRENLQRPRREIMQGRLKRQLKETIELSFGIGIEEGRFSGDIDVEKYAEFVDKVAQDTLGDIDDEIQTAEAKVNEVMKNLNQLGYGETTTEMSIKDLVQDYGSLMKRLTDSEGELIPLGKSSINILIKGNNKLDKLTKLSKKLLKDFNGYEKGLKEATEEILKDGLQIEEAFSIDDRYEELGFTDVEEFTNLRDEYITLRNELQEIVNEAGEEFAQLDRGSEKPKPRPERAFETKEEQRAREGSGRFKFKPSKRQPEGDEE